MQIVEGQATVEDTDSFVERLSQIGDGFDTTVQAFDARYIAGRNHLEKAVELAQRAIDRDEAIARDPGVEILLYAAGRRQINRALEIGVSEGECPVVVVVVGGDESGGAAAVHEILEPAETLGELDRERVSDFFNITKRELTATKGNLEDIVCERVALLTVER